MSRCHYQLSVSSVRRAGASPMSLPVGRVGTDHYVNGDLVRCIFSKINRVDSVQSYNLPSLELTLLALMHVTARLHPTLTCPTVTLLLAYKSYNAVLSHRTSVTAVISRQWITLLTCAHWQSSTEYWQGIAIWLNNLVTIAFLKWINRKTSSSVAKSFVEHCQGVVFCSLFSEAEPILIAHGTHVFSRGTLDA